MPATVPVHVEIFLFLLELAPAVKVPEAVVLPVSRIPSFGGHCCPGVLKPVPADDDLSFSHSGSSLPSFFKLKHTPDGGTEVCEMGLVRTVFRFREGLCLAFHWKYSQMLTTLRRQLIGGQYQVE